MFRIKICGVRTIQDVDAVSATEADAVGLNFFHRSIRFLDPAAAETRSLSNRAGERGLLRVGVFVNAAADEVKAVARQNDLELVQLHGDEPIEMAEELIDAEIAVVRAVKLPTGPIDSERIERSCEPWISAGCRLLIDADAGEAQGGSGKKLDWQSIGHWAADHPAVSWALAGGLTPDNVAAAIGEAGAPGVDVASGVESPRGRKSAELISKFVAAAAGQLGPRSGS